MSRFGSLTPWYATRFSPYSSIGCIQCICMNGIYVMYIRYAYTSRRILDWSATRINVTCINDNVPKPAISLYLAGLSVGRERGQGTDLPTPTSSVSARRLQHIQRHHHHAPASQNHLWICRLVNGYLEHDYPTDSNIIPCSYFTIFNFNIHQY